MAFVLGFASFWVRAEGNKVHDPKARKEAASALEAIRPAHLWEAQRSAPSCTFEDSTYDFSAVSVFTKKGTEEEFRKIVETLKSGPHLDRLGFDETVTDQTGRPILVYYVLHDRKKILRVELPVTFKETTRDGKKVWALSAQLGTKTPLTTLEGKPAARSVEKSNFKIDIEWNPQTSNMQVTLSQDSISKHPGGVSRLGLSNRTFKESCEVDCISCSTSRSQNLEGLLNELSASL